MIPLEGASFAALGVKAEGSATIENGVEWLIGTDASTPPLGAGQENIGSKMTAGEGPTVLSNATLPAVWPA